MATFIQDFFDFVGGQEIENSSVLEIFDENGIECGICKEAVCRDQLSLRGCRSRIKKWKNRSAKYDVSACIKANPICILYAKQMRNNGQNKCPFCRQPNAFRQPNVFRQPRLTGSNFLTQVLESLPIITANNRPAARNPYPGGTWFLQVAPDRRYVLGPRYLVPTGSSG
jgi:hypothetical protein